MTDANEIKLTHSSILSIEGKPSVSVRFDRGTDYAEGSVPDAKIMKSVGFSEEEIKELEHYLSENSRDLLVRAKDISGITHWFK